MYDVFYSWCTLCGILSFSLQKSAASEVVARSSKANGRHHSSFLSRDTFPDSVGTHFEMNG